MLTTYPTAFETDSASLVCQGNQKRIHALEGNGGETKKRAKPIGICANSPGRIQ